MVYQSNLIYNISVGAFTFQVQLYKDDGKIITVYKNIPQPIANLSTEDHPVKVGLSDAYYWDSESHPQTYLHYPQSKPLLHIQYIIYSLL